MRRIVLLAPTAPSAAVRRLLLGALLLATTTAAPAAATPPPAPRSAVQAARPAPAAASAAASAPPSPRWTDETPDAMIEDAKARALAPGAPQADILAAAIVIHALEPRAENGLAERALQAIATGTSGEVAGEVALLRRSLADDEGTGPGAEADRRLGVLTELAVLGPFRDTGGGLDAHEGPEAPAAPGGKKGSFADTRRRYSWGTVDVAWRAVPPHYASASGVPLDLFLAPRTESCSFVASAITVPRRQPLVVRVASTGSVRMVFDGKDVAESEDVATSATVDRLAALVTAEEGTHLVAVKVCTGALGDDGHVRLRLTDSHGAPLRLQASADLSTLPDLPPRPVARGLPGAAGARRPRGVDTLLGRVLSGRPDGRATTNVVPRLDEAVARTLGGADDSRSPRAPGLLDNLARRPELDADTLALIGWISPSGANRSSVLNRALSLAAGVDPRARAFAERRLIAQRLNSHLVDWGVATAQSTHLGKSDGEALLLNALLADALGTDALRTQALRELETFTIHQPSLAPTALLRELAHLAATYDPSQLRAAREVLAARGYRGHDLVSAMGTQSSDALAGAAKNAFDGNLEDADDGLAVADSLSRAGRHDDARAAYAQMTEWAPNRWEAWSGLAHELSLGGEAARPSVVLALRRARELAPGDAGLRAELAFRQNAAGRARGALDVDATARDDEKYLVVPDVFLSRRKGVPAGVPDVADRELYWLRAVVLHPDRRVSQLIQYARGDRHTAADPG